MTVARQNNRHQWHLLSGISHLLNRPMGRGLLGLFASFYSRFTTGRFVKIFYDEAWGHRYRDAVLFDRNINFSLSTTKIRVETEENWLFLYKPQAGDIVIDIGAGIGTETYYFSKAVGMIGKVISIEAHPQTFNCLKKLCEYNHMDNVIPLNLAIQDAESIVHIDDPTNYINATIVNAKAGFKVTGMSLDALVEELDISQIAFIKMNIEGAEKLAIRGMGNSIRKTRYICISCHDFLANRGGIEDMRTKDMVRDFLLKQGIELIFRDHDHREWIRDQLNGLNPHMVNSVVDDSRHRPISSDRRSVSRGTQ